MNELIEMNMNKDNMVVMSNDLIKSRSSLSLNEVKLLRLAIMQIVKEDKDLKTYRVAVTDLAKLLDIPASNIYRDIDDMTTHLLKEIVYVGDGNPKHAWKKFQWCSSCSYENGVLTIKIHDDLKPYLISLSKLYTQYILGDVLLLKSVYSIRIYELIKQEMKYQKAIGSETANVYLSIETIRKATDTETKYQRISQLEEKVISRAVNEINEKLGYYVEYEPLKEGKRYVGYKFMIQSKVYAQMSPEQRAIAEAKAEHIKEVIAKAKMR